MTTEEKEVISTTKSAEQQRARYRSGQDSARNREYRLAHPGWTAAKCKRWRRRNRETYRRSQTKYERTAGGRIDHSMRSAIRRALRGERKYVRIIAIVGCSASALKVHLERQFKRWMTWGNYGKRWQICHITPVRYFDLTEPAQLALCYNWQNLRPLSCEQNRREKNHRGASQLHLQFKC